VSRSVGNAVALAGCRRSFDRHRLADATTDLISTAGTARNARGQAPAFTAIRLAGTDPGDAAGIVALDRAPSGGATERSRTEPGEDEVDHVEIAHLTTGAIHGFGASTRARWWRAVATDTRRARRTVTIDNGGERPVAMPRVAGIDAHTLSSARAACRWTVDPSAIGGDAAIGSPTGIARVRGRMFGCERARDERDADQGPHGGIVVHTATSQLRKAGTSALDQ
jgi:hypothetical protein